MVVREEASDEKEDEEESASTVGSLKLVEMCGGSRHAEADIGDRGVNDQAVGASNVGEQGLVARCEP